MEKIGNICLICHGEKNLPLTTESSRTTRGSRAVRIPEKEFMTTLPCGHEFHYASIKTGVNERPRHLIDRRLITSTPLCFVNTRKQLLRSEKGGEIDNVREILSTGFNPGQRSLTEKQWEISAQLIKAGASTRNKIAHHQLGWMHQNGLGVEQSYAKALAWYRKAAEQGNAFAQNQLGWMHEKGLVVEQNYAEALTWYRKAADQGHAFAQNQLGCMHLDGLGVEQNYAEAFTWYRKAADQGHVDAQNQLGCMHQKGLGVQQSHADSLIWFRKAADQGHANAQNQLGWMYRFALEVELNYAEALTWYRKAADQGHADAQYQLGYMYQKGMGLEQHSYTDSLIWYRKAADQGHANAQIQLGYIYLFGVGVEQNDAEALIWFRKAADQGHADAQNQLGYMHQKGLGVEQSDADSLTWFRKATDQGHADAQFQLGWMYQFGKGVKQSYAEALIWYHKAADQGHADAQYQLGFMHQKGIGVKQNYAEALIWYRKAADQRHVDARNQLGWMHQYGLGVEQNDYEAFIWHRKAANQGHAFPIRLAHVNGRNGRRLKIVVCARQFMDIREIPQSSEQSNTGNDLTDRKVRKFIPCMSMESSILSRGYGDIASGVKGLELLQHENPEAEMSFIVEHFAETENELRRIVEMSELPNVKTIILDGYGNTWNHQLVRDKAIKTLNEATVIFHAPAGLIEPLMNSSGEYSKKTLAVSEYDDKSGGYSFYGEHGISEKEMGFQEKLLYLTPSRRETTDFKNTTLKRLFPTKDCAGKKPEDSDVPKKVLYFSYGHVLAAMNSMLRNAVINESLLERDIVFVTSLKMRIEEIEQIVSKTYSTLHLTQPIKLMYEENGDGTVRIIPKDADEQATKTFNIVSIDCIEKEDFALLEQYSTFNYTSGDISTTNVLGFGKIPFVDCKKKARNYHNMYEKLIQFANRAFRDYKKSGKSGLMAPEEIRNTIAEIINSIKHWENVCKSLSEYQNELPDDELKNLSRSLIALNSPVWLKFQGEFTDWLKSSHSADEFILNGTREIIVKSFSPLWKASRYR